VPTPNAADAGAARAPTSPTPSARAPGAPAAPDPTLGHVEGTVRDALTAAPLPAVDVIFAGPGGDTTGASGTDGRYRVALAPGRYTARATGEDVFGVTPEVVQLAPGARITSFDLRVARLATVSGRVVDAAGKPAAGAIVTFEAELLRERVESKDLEPDGEARTGDDGAFTVRVAPGEVLLLAKHGGARATRALPSVAPAAKLAGIELVLPALARVRGVVFDPARRPVAGATVHGRGGGVDVEARTASDGAFELALPAARLAVQARAPGFADSKAVTVEPAKSDRVELVLGESLRVTGRVLLPDGGPAAGAIVQARSPTLFAPPRATAGPAGEFTLEGLDRDPVDLLADYDPYAPARQRRVRPPRDGVVLQLAARGRIVGRVTADGAPVPDFTVRVDSWMPANSDERIDNDGGLRRLAPDGTYVLDRLQPGTYVVIVAAPGYAPGRRAGIVVRPDADADGSVELTRGAALEGLARDARSGSAVAGAIVTATSGHEGDAVYTDEQGRFVLEDIAPGRRSVEIDHPGYVRRVEAGIVLRAGERRRLEVAMSALEPGKGGAARAIEFAGIGAVLSGTGAFPCIQSLLPGSPGELAGLRPGDCITAIDGTPSTGGSFMDEIEQIRGVAGTAVRLSIDRAGSSFTVDVVRGNIRFDEQP
jgi:hypothetical protein